MLINSKGYHDRVTVFSKLGSAQKWRLINTTDDAHPMHVHPVQRGSGREHYGRLWGRLDPGKPARKGMPSRGFHSQRYWLPLSVLLSQVIVAFAIYYEKLSPVSLSLSAAIIRRIRAEGRRLRELAKEFVTALRYSLEAVKSADGETQSAAPGE